MPHAGAIAVCYSTPVLKRFLLMVSFAVSAAPCEAMASACCGEASGLGDRLLDAEVAAVTVRAGGRGRFGGFGADGTFHALPEGVGDGELSLSASTTARITPRLELGAEVSGKLNVRASQGESKVGGGGGDVRPHARLAVRKATEDRYFPGVYTTVAAVIPTGSPASRSLPGSLQSDITGQGNAEVLLGLALEKTYESAVFVRAEASVGFFIPETIDTVAVARSPRLSASGLVGPVLDPVVVGAGVLYEHEAAPPGAPADTSGRTKIDIVVAGSLDLSARISLLANVRSALPVDGFGSNELASVNGSLGARFGFF